MQIVSFEGQRLPIIFSIPFSTYEPKGMMVRIQIIKLNICALLSGAFWEGGGLNFYSRWWKKKKKKTGTTFCHLVFPALLDMFQWNHRGAVPPLWGDVRRLWSVGNQSAHRDHLLLCGDHYPATDHTGLQVCTHTSLPPLSLIPE